MCSSVADACRRCASRVPVQLPIFVLIAVLMTPTTAAALAPVRPRAVVRVEIGSRLYRTKLDGDGSRCGARCAALEQALSDAARGIFSARFRFVDWRDRAESTADTIVVRLREKPIGGHIEIVVALLGRSRTFASDSMVTKFDDFFEAKARDASYWSPSRLQRNWSDRIDRALESNAPLVIQSVIGRLPLGASVNLPGADSSSRVDVSADSLRAAADPPLTFLVRVNIEEVVQNTTLKRQGELKLLECQEGDAPGQKRYVCRRLAFSVMSPTRAAADFVALSARSRITKASVHLFFYTSSRSAVASDGTVRDESSP